MQDCSKKLYLFKCLFEFSFVVKHFSFLEQQMIYETGPCRLEESLKMLHYFNCLISRNLFYILTLSLPEMVMYGITFKSIVCHTKFLAVNGLLQPETIKKRKKKNLVNIYMTFWAWLVQLISNICLMLLVKIVYAKSQFLYNLFGLLSLCLSFNILPFLYIVMASEKHKWGL